MFDEDSCLMFNECDAVMWATMILDANVFRQTEAASNFLSPI